MAQRGDQLRDVDGDSAAQQAIAVIRAAVFGVAEIYVSVMEREQTAEARSRAFAAGAIRGLQEHGFMIIPKDGIEALAYAFALHASGE